MSEGFTDLDDWYYQPLGQRYFKRCWEKIKRLLEPRPQLTILDAGCGAGHYSEQLVGIGAKVYGSDVNSMLVERAKMRVPSGLFHVAPLENLPFSDRQFDYAICCNVLEFVADPELALSELRRVCREGSVVIVLNESSLWEWQQRLARPFTQHPYYQGKFFSLERLSTVARDAGWQVKKLEPLITFPPVPIESVLNWAEGHFTNACWIAQLQ